MSEQGRRLYDQEDANNRVNKFALSPEESALIKECQSESFYCASLPLSCVMGVGTQILIHKGIIKGKLLALPAIITGYVVGRIAYVPTCRKKFEEKLPNSPLTQFLSGKVTQQEYYDIKKSEFQSSDTGFPLQQTNREADYNDDNHLAGNRDETNGSTTYEDLRRKHREQARTTRPKFDKQQIGEVDWSESRMNDRENPSDKGKKNQYGDVLDDAI